MPGKSGLRKARAPSREAKHLLRSNKDLLQPWAMLSSNSGQRKRTSVTLRRRYIALPVRIEEAAPAIACLFHQITLTGLDLMCLRYFSGTGVFLKVAYTYFQALMRAAE